MTGVFKRWKNNLICFISTMLSLEISLKKLFMVTFYISCKLYFNCSDFLYERIISINIVAKVVKISKSYKWVCDWVWSLHYKNSFNLYMYEFFTVFRWVDEENHPCVKVKIYILPELIGFCYRPKISIDPSMWLFYQFIRWDR